MYFLGDIGGTKTRLVFIDKIHPLPKQVYKYLKQNTRIFNTPQKYADFLELIENYFLYEFALNLRKSACSLHSSALKVCFGFAGLFDKKKEKLIYAPNLKDYIGRNLKKDLEKILSPHVSVAKNNIRLNPFNNPHLSVVNKDIRVNLRNNPRTSVVLENDAALAGLGEAYFGVGNNFNSFGYITLGTGIGGVKIVKREPMRTERELLRTKFFIDDNVFGFEPGHSFILIQSKTNNILPFEIEELVGGKSLEKIFKKKPEEIKDKKFWDNLSKILAIFLVNVSIFWSVDKIILGGGLIKSLDIKRLTLYLNKINPIPPKIKIIKSKLEDLAVLAGCFSLLKSKYNL